MVACESMRAHNTSRHVVLEFTAASLLAIALTHGLTHSELIICTSDSLCMIVLVFKLMAHGSRDA